MDAIWLKIASFGCNKGFTLSFSQTFEITRTSTKLKHKNPKFEAALKRLAKRGRKNFYLLSGSVYLHAKSTDSLAIHSLSDNTHTHTHREPKVRPGRVASHKANVIIPAVFCLSRLKVRCQEKVNLVVPKWGHGCFVAGTNKSASKTLFGLIQINHMNPIPVQFAHAHKMWL